jgi:hypothetical protein
MAKSQQDKIVLFSNPVLSKKIALAQIAVEILLWSLRNKRLERIAGLASNKKSTKICLT